MCDNHTVSPPDPSRREDPGARPTRRQVLSGVLAAGGVSVLWSATRGRPALAATRRPSSGTALVSGQAAVAMAMHLHASFSEGDASMATHLSEAAANGVPVVWFTEHDWRMSQVGYRQALHFTSLTGEKEGANPAWKLQPATTGTLAAGSGGGIVTSPYSPLDPASPGALRVRAVSTAAAPASYRFWADTKQARSNQRANVVGQAWDLEVYPLEVGTDAWLELLVGLSYRPPTGGRPTGWYQLSYRFGTEAAGRAAQGLLGVVTVGVTPGQWNSVHLDPLSDIAALWPDVVAEDNATVDLWWGATSRNGAPAEGFFDYHRFGRDPAAVAGDAPLALQRSVLDRYQALYPGVTALPGIEYSYYSLHTNGFGPDLHLPSYASGGGRTFPPNDPTFNATMADTVAAAGGVTSYNHPFGVGDGKVWSTAQQDDARRKVAASMLANGANRATLLEAGYVRRGNAGLDAHLQLADTMSRNGLLLTYIGVTDDHSGHTGTWRKGANRYITSAWSPSPQITDLVAALRAGRAFCASLRDFDGAVDLVVDGVVPMGSVSVRPDLASRQLQVMATNLPSGGSVQVVRGPVDYAGAAFPDPATQVVQTLAGADVATGSATLAVDTATSAFFRVNVVNGSGTVVAFSNPVWLLREPPPAPVPPERRAPDSV